MKTQSVVIPSLILSLAALCTPTSLTLAEDQRRFGQVDQKTATLETLHSMPLAFTQNNGQWPDSVLFRASGGGTTMWLVRDGIYYQFTRRIGRSQEGQAALVSGSGPRRDRPTKFNHEADSVESMLIKAEYEIGRAHV